MKVNWPYRNRNNPIFASPKMECGRNEYKPSGEEFTMAEVIDKLAADNEHFAEKFLEGWQQMTSNGYGIDGLVDGPQNGWFGYFSLMKQGKVIMDFEKYIANNAPVTFTDPKVRKAHFIILWTNKNDCQKWSILLIVTQIHISFINI